MGEYQRAKDEGRIGSRKESTWSKELHTHVCCKSKHSWYHKPNCPALVGSFIKKENISKEKLIVQEFKKKGANSLEVSKKLDINLDEVNALWS